ncbi:MAG: pyridoxal phosphate-dependent aminotransferase family protein [Simkaniaceae bacterium]|nr:pyridoxal phosphate-dependent aminotransferase family protein [Simkaniaceae bacterium]
MPSDDTSSVSDKLINFSSNDFLGLSKHPHVKKTTIKRVLDWGVGSSPTRLLTKHLEYQMQMEDLLAKLLGKKQSLLFQSGPAAQNTLLKTLISSQTQLFIDTSISPALFRNAKMTAASTYLFDRNDMDQLEKLLIECEGDSHSSRIILTASLTLMDGNLCPMQDLILLGSKHRAILCVDDTLTIGMMGKYGMGFTSHREGVDISFGSFGSDCGSFGGFIAGSNLMKDYITSFSPSFQEMSTLSPASLGALHAAFELIPDMDNEREKTLTLSKKLQEVLLDLGWDLEKSPSHIIPIALSDESKTLRLYRFLQEKSIVTTLIKSQSIPLGFSKIALTLNATHTQEDIEALVSILHESSREDTLATV